MAIELSTIELKHVKLTLAAFTALAGVYEPHTQYFVATPATASRPDGGLEIWLSSNDGSYAYRVLNEVDVMTMIADNVSTVTDTYIKSTIVDRDAGTYPAGKFSYVYTLDATGDATVTSGGALYLYNPSVIGAPGYVAGEEWIKLSEQESMDAVIDWANIQNKPSSTIAEIDAAVAAKHTHDNKLILDKFDETAEGEVTYNGKELRGSYLTTDGTEPW